MAFERIELNICPAGDMPIFHCSQYDVGRPIIIDLKNGDDAFTPTAGTTFELHCRKVDDNIVTLDTYEVDGNTLTFTSTEQLCACPGDNLCEVAIYLDELCMGTLNFMLHVEPDPLAGGLESETQIYNLTEQVEEITEQVIGDDYYNKTEVDDLLDTKADAATTYTKTEVDTALNLKADKSTTYTKTETNNLLAGKADASDTYTKAQVDNALALKANSADLATVATTGDYDDLLNKPTIPAAQVQSDYAQADNTKVDYIKNKPDIDAMIADALLEVMPVDTASGAIATFNTELAAPLVNVSCNVVATGGYDADTQTAHPINGYTEAKITRCGVNFLNIENSEQGGIDASGTEITSSQTWRANALTSIVPDVKYTLSIDSSKNYAVRLYFYDANGTFISPRYEGVTSVTATAPSNAKYFKWTIYTASETTLAIIQASQPQLETGATRTTYHAYNGQTYTIAFGQTVYGGQLIIMPDRTYFHATWKGVDLGDLNWIYRGPSFPNVFSTNSISDYKLVNDVNALCSIYAFGGTVVGIGNATEDKTTYFYYVSGLSDHFLYIKDTAYTDKNTFITAVTGQKLVYELATPFDIDLTPVQIRALVGENNVYSDTNGNTTVKFKDSIQHYIDTKVGS